MTPAVILALVGAGLTASGVVVARENARFRRRAQRARGTIVELRATSSRTESGGLLYHPVVAFTSSDGREVRGQSPVGRNPPPGRVGDAVTVLYDPLDPERIRLDTITGRGGCLTFAVIGVGVATLAVAAVVAVLTSG